MNVKGTILHPASKPQFDQSRFAVTATSSVQLSNLGTGTQTPQNHASAVKPANYSQITTTNSNSAQATLARIQQMQSNSSKQTYLASSTNIHPASNGIGNSSKGSIDPQSSPGLKGNSSLMSGVSMSGLSENLLRHQSKQSFKVVDSDDRIKSIVNLNPAIASSMQIQAPGLNKPNRASGGHQMKQTHIQTQKFVMEKSMNEGPLLQQKHYRQSTGGNTIFKNNNNTSYQYDQSNKSALQQSQFSENNSITPTKSSDLNVTDDQQFLNQAKEGMARQYNEQLNNKSKLVKTNMSHRQLPSSVLAATYQMQLNSNGKTPGTKTQTNQKQFQQKMQVILKSKSPEPSLNANNLKTLQQHKTPFQSKTSAYPTQSHTNTTKTPVDPILKTVESQRVQNTGKNESIVCPIYPSKDFRLINPTNSSITKQFDHVQITGLMGQKMPRPKLSDELVYKEQLFHKAQSPDPNNSERVRLEQPHYSKKTDKNGRRSSTMSREPTMEDVYMTQRAQQAILAGKKKKHKKTDCNYFQSHEEQMAQQIAVEQYFEGTDQIDLKRSLRSSEKKSGKKSSLSRLEAERYLKMLSMSQLEQLEKSSPTMNFKGNLPDSTASAYQTKVKSKSQSGFISLKMSSKKNADNSQNLSETSSQDPSNKKGKQRRVRLRSSEANNSQQSGNSPNKTKKKLRKSAISPQTPNTLQEPSAKALPTSNKVKINTKFNKFGSSGDKQTVEKTKAQAVNNGAQKKNLFQKKSMTGIITNDKFTFSPQQKAPGGLGRHSIRSSSNNVNSKKSIQFNDAPIGIEGETKQLSSKQVYGIRSSDKIVMRDSFEQAQLSPIAQYYNQAHIQTASNTDTQQKYSNSQLFQISQLRHSVQNPKLSISNEHSGRLLSKEDRLTKKRASTISSKKDHEQASNKGRKDDKATIFACEHAAKNFRSTSPSQRETEMQPFTDLKLKNELLSEKGGFNPQAEGSQQIQKKVLQIFKRTSMSPHQNLLFSLPSDNKQKTGVENLLKLFPKTSPKVSPDPKAQTHNFNLHQIKSVLTGSASVSQIKHFNADILQKLNARASPKLTQKQQIAEMAIHQKVLRLSRPTSNDIIKTFQISKAKFLSPEIKAREVISPDNLLNRKTTSSPQLSNKSNQSGSRTKIKNGKQSGYTTTKTKTNSQLGPNKIQNIQNVVNTSGSARALFNAKNQAEVVLNRISMQSKTKIPNNKESLIKPSGGGSGKHHRKAPTVTVPLNKVQQQTQSHEQLIAPMKNQQLFKKSTLQKSSVIANAAKKNQLRDSLEAPEPSPQNIDEICDIVVIDILTQPSIRMAKGDKSSIVTQKGKATEEESKYFEKISPVKTKKTQMLIGDQVFSESQKKRPILNHITEASEMTPQVKGGNNNQSLSRSMVSGVQSDKEQLQFNRDLQKLIKMFRLHFKQFNQAPPTNCEFYRIGRVLGKGAFGKVNFAMHKLSEQLVAIKSMSKETLQSEEDLRRRTKLEMGILQQSNHPNVVRLFDTFETQKHICFVMELCSGGDLFTYIKKRRRLKEDNARFFFKQIIEGLAYIHNVKLVVHRDIKLENILLDATGQVKICDFGVSRQLKTEKQVMHEQCGTPAYIAPEILKDQGYSGFKVDMWSAGVCLYAMLIGSVPFKAATMAALQELITKGQYDLKFQTSANSNKLNNPKAATTILSEEVKDLIKRLLSVDPAKRLSAVQALEHPWLKDAPIEFDVFTDKEKSLIQKEYMRLNLKKSSRIKESLKSSRHSCSLIQETEQALFTEHNLETKNAEDEEPQMQNHEEKSYILAPFNSIKSMFIESQNQPVQEKSSEPFIWPEEIIKLIVPRRVIKFAKKCREKNRIYEQNNNADLDNGVYNEFVNEQEKEEGALYKKDSDESEEEPVQLSPKSFRESKKSDDTDEQVDLLKDTSSDDSLQKSFHQTQLSSDDERADNQIKATHREWEQNQQNKKAFDIYEKDEKDDEELDPIDKMQMDKKTPPCVPGVSPHRKFKSSIGPASAAQKVLMYQEKEFFIDQAVIAQIESMSVVPKAYLFQELAYGSDRQRAPVTDQKTIRKMNYVTALYYLLVKRQELQQIQVKQRQQ